MLTFQGAHYCLMSNFSSTPHVLPCRTALNPLIPHSQQILRIALTQGQNLEVHTGVFLKPVKVSLHGTPFPQHITCAAQLGVICKPSKGTLKPTVYVINKNIDHCQSQYRPLRDTTSY